LQTSSGKYNWLASSAIVHGRNQGGQEEARSFWRRGRETTIFVTNVQLTTQKGTTLFVNKSNAATGTLTVNPICTLDDPDEGKDGEAKGGPVNEAAETCGQVRVEITMNFDVRRRALMIEDGPQCPRNDDSAGEITIN
jgi:hypothetical protein